MQEVVEKLEQLSKILIELAQKYDGLTVAYSGGVDSAFLLAASERALKELEEPPPLIAITALSPSYPSWEREPAQAFAQSLGITHLEVETDELERAAYRANQGDRCFHCKEALFDVAELTRGGHREDRVRGALVYGAITDDLGDHRPGMESARLRGVHAPLIDAGLNKREVRWLSKEMGLVTWDKPASACLASRFPRGIEVTAARLEQVGRCEARLLTLDLRVVRARYHGELVRIELGHEELEKVLGNMELRQAVVRAGKAVGFKYVSIDLEGYRSGSGNDAALVVIS